MPWHTSQNWGTGADCCSNLTFKSEPRQMEVDERFNYFGARSEKARGFLSLHSGWSFRVTQYVTGCWWSLHFPFFWKGWEKSLQNARHLPCGTAPMTGTPGKDSVEGEGLSVRMAHLLPNVLQHLNCLRLLEKTLEHHRLFKTKSCKKDLLQGSPGFTAQSSFSWHCVRCCSSTRSTFFAAGYSLYVTLLHRGFWPTQMYFNRLRIIF